MLPDLLSTLLALALVCSAVLDQAMLETHGAILAVCGIAMAALGIWANRVDYLKLAGMTVIVAGRRDFAPVRVAALGGFTRDLLLGGVLVRQSCRPGFALVSALSRPARSDRQPKWLTINSRRQPMILFSGYSTIPTAPASSSFGNSSRTVCSAMIVSTASHSLPFRCGAG